MEDVLSHSLRCSLLLTLSPRPAFKLIPFCWVGGFFFCWLSAFFCALPFSSLSPAMCCTFNLPSNMPSHYLSICLFNSTIIRPCIRLHPSSSPPFSLLFSERHQFHILTSTLHLLPCIFLFLFFVISLFPLSSHFNSKSACWLT